jgi:ATP-dependent DNA helicase 2 subunit 2
MGEVLYIWPDPEDTRSQVSLSAIVQAMDSLDAVAVIRHVGRNGSNPKLGLAKPMIFDSEEAHIECLHWVQVGYMSLMFCSTC